MSVEILCLFLEIELLFLVIELQEFFTHPCCYHFCDISVSPFAFSVLQFLVNNAYVKLALSKKVFFISLFLPLYFLIEG